VSIKESDIDDVIRMVYQRRGCKPDLSNE
jgi:hypothetical protein